MWKLFQIELYKIFKRPRTYIAFGVISSLILIIQLGLKLDGKEYFEFVFGSLKDQFAIEGNVLNGYFVCYFVLQYLLVQVPMLIALVSADMVSGEANMGTLRVMLTKPLSRTTFILSKFFAASVYTFILLLWIAALGLGLSVLIFGTDDLIIGKNNYVVLLESSDVMWRYAATFCFAYLAMLTVTALGFFLSLFAENSIGPIVTTIGIIIFLTVISTMSIPFYKKIQPYLFTTHMVTWKEFFDAQVNDETGLIKGSIQYPQRIVKASIILVVYIVGLVSASIFVFRKKDILS